MKVSWAERSATGATSVGGRAMSSAGEAEAGVP